MLSCSELQLSLLEEAYRGGGAAEHRDEPHRGGDRRDEPESVRAQSAVWHAGGGHDPAAAQTAGQRQREGDARQIK